MNLNTFGAKSLARYGNWTRMAQQNRLLYFRLKYLHQRKAWPAHTQLDLTEYGWLLKCGRRNPRPLATSTTTFRPKLTIRRNREQI